MDEGLGLAGGFEADRDAADVARANNGDREAFESLVHRHERALYRVALRMLGDPEEAMDAVQESFVRIYRALPRFRGEAAFGTWAYGITLNVCRSRQSSKETRISRLSDPLESSRSGDGDPVALPLPDRSPLPDDRALAGELRGAVLQALGRLAPEHREIVVLREIEGLEYEEIGEALDIAPGTVKSRLSRARRALREALEGIWP